MAKKDTRANPNKGLSEEFTEQNLENIVRLWLDSLRVDLILGIPFDQAARSKRVEELRKTVTDQERRRKQALDAIADSGLLETARAELTRLENELDGVKHWIERIGEVDPGLWTILEEVGYHAPAKRRKNPKLFFVAYMYCWCGFSHIEAWRMVRALTDEMSPHPFKGLRQVDPASTDCGLSRPDEIWRQYWNVAKEIVENKLRKELGSQKTKRPKRKN